MNQTGAIWLVLVLAFLAANLPFLTQRVLGVVPLAGGKSLGVRLAELVFLYFLVGGIGMLLEQRASDGVELPSLRRDLPGALFLTFAFPGFVWRYLHKPRH